MTLEFYAKDASLIPEEELDRIVSSYNTPMLTLTACLLASMYKGNFERGSYCKVKEDDTSDSNHCC